MSERPALLRRSFPVQLWDAWVCETAVLILHVSEHDRYNQVVQRKVLGAIPAVGTAPLLGLCLGRNITLGTLCWLR